MDKRIEVKVTSVPRAGGLVLLIECSACGPVAVDSRPGEVPGGAGLRHISSIHGIIGKVSA